MISDNRKSNLRIATRSQNMANREYPNKTGYRGVAELPTGKFIAQIDNEYIGSYETAQQAHEAYMSEAVKKYGEFLYDVDKDIEHMTNYKKEVIS